MPSLSVVIATHQRAPILRQCLAHLEQQSIAEELEVIVVSDGEDAETERMMAATREMRHATRYCSIPKSQQGVARNAGVQQATGDTILFLGDDIFLEPDACALHRDSHAASATNAHATLGFTTWDPACGITPVMRWLEKTGWQFGYPQLVPYAHRAVPATVQHRFTYTSNISVPRSVALAHPFQEEVTLYGWEDIVWGMRLREAGIPLVYEPDAKALHHHHITLDDSLRRMETIGRSAVFMAQREPGFDSLPQGWKRYAYRLLSLLPTLRGRHANALLNGITAAALPSEPPAATPAPTDR